ncbi:MAG: YciI family protein [Beijerinckiaceae bacterium]
MMDKGKPQFLYVLRPARPDMLQTGLTERETAAVQAHFAYVQKMTDAGVMFLVGRTQTTGPDTMGLAIFEADDEAAARVIMNNDPALRDGVMTGTLYPYKIALMRTP